MRFHNTRKLFRLEGFDAFETDFPDFEFFSFENLDRDHRFFGLRIGPDFRLDFNKAKPFVRVKLFNFLFAFFDRFLVQIWPSITVNVLRSFLL
jgi:hypothetical protein